MKQSTSVILTLLAILLPLSLSAEEIRLNSDTAQFDGKGNFITATGNVRASWKDAVITSRMLKYGIESGLLEASGDIVVKKENESLKATEMTLIIPSGTGIFHNTEIRLLPGKTGQESSSSVKSPLVFKGSRIEKKSENDFSAEKGSFTTCEAEPPSWRFEAETIDMTVDGYAKAKNALFRVGDLPIFYFPYIIFPAKTERQSGLLLPQFGRSSDKGFIYSQPLYLVFSPSFDATFTFREESKRGEGVAEELRYLRKRASSGTLKADLFSDRENSSTRGMVDFKWLENFSDRVSSRGDLTFISYKNYFADFGSESGEYNRGFTDSLFSLEWRGESYQLTSGGRFFREIESSLPSEPVNTLPYIDMTIMRKNLGQTGVYASLKSRASHFTTPDGDADRIYIYPEVSSSIPLTSYLNLSLSSEYKLHGYRHENSANSALEGYGQFDGKALLTTGIERNYGWWRHTLFPSIGYGYQNKPDRKSIPLFDSDDIPEWGDTITWEMLNLFESSGKDANGALFWKDAARVRLSGVSRITGERGDLLKSSANKDDKNELRLETTLFPLKKLSLYSDTRYNPSASKSSSSYLAAKYDFSAKKSASFGYYQADQRFSYMEGGAQLSLASVNLEYRGRYSFDRQGFLESLYRVEYRHQCWGVGLSYRERPGIQDLMFSVTLAGL